MRCPPCYGKDVFWLTKWEVVVDWSDGVAVGKRYGRDQKSNNCSLGDVVAKQERTACHGERE